MTGERERASLSPPRLGKKLGSSANIYTTFVKTVIFQLKPAAAPAATEWMWMEVANWKSKT